jgi:DNA replication protein DnaC
VLILDDLGAETGSAWSDGVLFEILDYRYRNRLPTMIATNVAPDDFDPRIASRMQDRSFCTVIENAAPDFRRRPKKER